MQTIRTLLLSCLLLLPSCGSVSNASRLERAQSWVGLVGTVLVSFVDTARAAGVIDEDAHRRGKAAVQHAIEAVTQAIAAIRAATEPLPPPPEPLPEVVR